ncbi:MAG: MBL fold metallo-hydrolase [Acidobacteria bacterium]|nr:MBL fold metallo-hydrolase [Acidobacteriota bacterium]
MKRVFVRLLWSAFVLLIAIPASAQSFQIIKVAEGVYAAIGQNGVFCNGTFIVNQDEVVVVDTHLRPSWAKDLIAEIKKVTDKPVRYVINTHWHGDHTQGNQAYVGAFGSHVEYLAQHNTRDDIIHKAIPSIHDSLTKDVPEGIARMEKALTDGKDAQGNALTDEQRKSIQTNIAMQKAYLEELKSIQITLPTITFERSLILHRKAQDGSDRPIHIYFLGKGHTRGDVVVFLPKEKVVSTGDLLTNGIPFMRDSYPSHWAATLEGVQKLDWTKAIPGHGNVQDGKDQIGKLIAYFKDLVTGVKEAIAKNQSEDDAVKSVDLSKHTASFPNFRGSSPTAVRRTYAELTGKIVD